MLVLLFIGANLTMLLPIRDPQMLVIIELLALDLFDIILLFISTQPFIIFIMFIKLLFQF